MMRKNRITRRDFLIKTLGTTLGAGALASGLPRWIPEAAAGSWAEMPKGKKPDEVTMVVWQFAQIYERIVPRFQADWGVPVNAIIEPNVEPQVAKLTAMFAAGEYVDVSQSPIQYLASYIDQGIAAPIDDMPGAQEYINDFTGFTKQIAQRDGKTWGLPYFSTAWIFAYNEEKLEKAGLSQPFTSYEELVDQSMKAKKDGVVKYPILWVAGVGFEQLPGTWYSMIWNQGGTIFDKQLNHQLGPGSVARKTLAWWRKTFVDWEIADPRSLEVRFIPATKVFNTGDYIYLGTLHHYYLKLMNDPAQSPIAGKVKAMMMPGNGGTIGYTMLYIMSEAAGNKEWAWKLLQYLGGRTKDGVFTQANSLATDVMLGSGYQSVMQSEVVRKGWAPWGDVDMLLKQWDKATGWLEFVPAVSEPWYPKWSDAINVELQNCLMGKITADQACDNMIAALKKVKRMR